MKTAQYNLLTISEMVERIAALQAAVLLIFVRLLEGRGRGVKVRLTTPEERMINFLDTNVSILRDMIEHFGSENDASFCRLADLTGELVKAAGALQSNVRQWQAREKQTAKGRRHERK